MIDASSAPVAGPRLRRPWLAALLSFVMPGLGQAYSGRYRIALLMAVPVIILAVAAISVVGTTDGPARNSLLSNDFLVMVLGINIALLIWRGIAIAHAGLHPWDAIRDHDRRTSLMVVAGLLVLTLGMHAWVGGVVIQLNDTLSQVFATDRPDPGGPPAGGDDPEPEEPVNEPDYEWDGTDRINILMLGTDAAPGREAVLTDVILALSIDPVERTAVMISVPRDTALVPLPDEMVYADGLFPDKVNALMARAAAQPEAWCPDLEVETEEDAQVCGLRTIERSIGLYLGIEIHHYALIDMAGFADLIDALGGLELCLPGRLVDPEFDGSLENRGADEPLVLPAGCHTYDGLEALAYARSRKGWIEMPNGEQVAQSDFERNERQQAVLLAMRREIAEGDTFLELPDILRAVARTVSTDFPRDKAGDLASLLPLITGPDIDRVVLSYPEYVDLPENPAANYVLIPRRDAIRDEMERIFGRRELVGWYLASEAEGPGRSDGEATAP